MKKCHAEICHCTDFNRRFCKDFREEKPVKDTSLKAKTPLRKTPLKTKRKATGEMELFKALWEKRKHRCFVTGQKLEFSPSIFFHILGKGAFPGYRLNPSNIIFVNAEYHTDWHTIGREKLLKKDPRWQRVFDLYEMLKIEYSSNGGI